jgi:hypothetical protein
MALSIMDMVFAQNAVLIRYKLFDNTIGMAEAGDFPLRPSQVLKLSSSTLWTILSKLT